MRTASSIDPCSLICPRSLHDERVIILPFPYRVAEPPWLGIFGEVSPVCPDYAPYLAKLVQDDHVQRRLKNLSRSQFIKFFTGESLGITINDWIICIRGKNTSNSIARLMSVQGLQPQGSVGYLMFRLSVFRHGPRPKGLDSLVAWVPNP